jgi:hypothetical protein
MKPDTNVDVASNNGPQKVSSDFTEAACDQAKQQCHSDFS